MTATATDNKHPAPFTESIIEALAEWIPVWVPEGYGIHDPFGGDGQRLGALCDRIGFPFTGTDLERWRDSDSRVAVGNSRFRCSYPTGPQAVVTSPTYNNGVNDHFKPKDTSRRRTYRVAAGHELHEDNTGRYSGRGSKRAEYDYWRISNDVVFCWPDLAIVNVKDSIRNGETYPLVQKWIDLLTRHRYTVGRVGVACPGWRFGTNSQARIDDEAILLAARKPA